MSHTPIITLKNITKSYDGKKVLDGISFCLYRGQTLVLAGANGAGKTVLASLIAGLRSPDSGEIVFAQGFSERSCGLVFQEADSQLIGETAEEDVALGPSNLKLPEDETERRVKHALSAVGLLEKAEYNPRTLSGGEKRRLAVAGILAMEREVVLFDEPFAHLDYPSVADTLRLIVSLKSEGKTLVILTHELEKVLAHADALAVLVRGTLAAIGSPASVLVRLEPAWGVRDPRASYNSIEDCTWL